MFATIFAALLVGHYLGDYFIQTDHQAQHKDLTGSRSWEGRFNCAKHAVTYTSTLAWPIIILMILGDITGSSHNQTVITVGLLLNGVTHYVIDRRWTLRGFAYRIGKRDWVDNDPAALGHLDQAAHIIILGVVSMMMAQFVTS